MRRTRLWWLRPFANRIVNPVARHVAGRVPGVALVTHVGRRTGRTYRTPMAVFRDADHCVFVLTYGSGADWVRNVLAAGRCTIRTRRGEIRLVEPEIVVDPACRIWRGPAPVRLFRRLAGVTELLRMRSAP